MKKTALILSLLAASTSGAWAQSSVTMYGIVDAGVRYTSNANVGSSQYLVVPGGMSQSRLGFNVTEDMGGGLKAIANLEHRLNSDTGTAAAEFWRQSWVGLQSADFGRITVGRQYNVLFDIYTSTYASFKYSPYIETYKPEIGLSMGARQDNMVKYLIESGGLRGELQVSAGEGAAGLPNKSVGGLLRYAVGELALGGGYLEVSENNGAKVKGATVGAAWSSGPWYVNASWAQNKFDSGVSATTKGTYTAGIVGSVLNLSASDVKQRDMYAVGLTYQLTPQINLGGHYWHTTQTHQVSGSAESKGDFFAAVADYAFSKRTDAYAEFDYTKFSDGYVKFANGATHRYGATVGVRHRF